MYTYQLTLNEPYFRVSIARYYQQRSFWLRPETQFAAIGVVTVVAAIWLAPVGVGRVGFIIAMSMLAAVFAIGGLIAVRVLVYRKFRHASYFGAASTTMLTDEGVAVRGSRGENVTAWSKYQAAVRYFDGIMLLRQGAMWWLPDASLANG